MKSNLYFQRYKQANKTKQTTALMLNERIFLIYNIIKTLLWCH